MPIRARRGKADVIGGAPSGSGRGRRPWSQTRLAAAQLHERVARRSQPRPGLAVRPADPDLRIGRIAEAHVDPAELSAAMAATDGQLARHDPPAEPDVEPAADRVAVRATGI